PICHYEAVNGRLCFSRPAAHGNSLGTPGGHSAPDLDVMKKIVLPWIKKVAGERPWVWQQDSAPCHVSKKSQDLLAANTYDFVPKTHWPPSSTDFNPMDYFLLGYLERHTNRLAHNTKAALINSIMKQARKLDRALVAKAGFSFRARIQRVIDTEGRWIE
ncbi:Putative LOC100197594, partial [Caligus rogercresseyi]